MEDKLLRHGGIIFSASAVSFFFAYIFQFYMARSLGPEDYGILGSMLSLSYIFSVPSGAITTTLTQIVSEQKVKQDYGKIKSMLLISEKKLMYTGLIIFALLISLTPFLENILNLPSKVPIIILGFSLIFMIMLPSPRGVLQGLQEFSTLGFNIAIEKPALLFFGAFFIYLGMGINGAVLSYGIAAIVVLILSFMPLRSILERKSEQVNVSVNQYALPVFVLVLSITIMSSVDIFFVRRYFPAEVSGYFTALKMLGQVTYFLSIALGGVLLSKVSGLNTLNKAHEFLLKKALIYFGIFLAAILTIYATTPETIITILFGKVYSSMSQYLIWYASAMGLLSFAIIFMVYDVSTKKTAFTYPLVLFTILEIVSLVMFHETLNQIITIQAISYLMLLTTVIIINIRHDKWDYLKKYVGGVRWKLLG